jgi:steroid delta-isomerase-like uncharacterized protein
MRRPGKEIEPMTPDAMKAYVQRHFQEFVNAKNVDIANETLADDFLDHDGPGGRPIDRDGDRAMMRAMQERFPDLRVTIEDMIAEGDKVVCRNVWRATDPASGKKIQFKGIVIWRLADGKLVERWASVEPPR